MDEERVFSLSYEQLTRFAENASGNAIWTAGRNLSLRVSQSRSCADLLA